MMWLTSSRCCAGVTALLLFATMDSRAWRPQGCRALQCLGLDVLENLVAGVGNDGASTALSRVMWTQFRDVALPNVLGHSLQLLAGIRRVLYHPSARDGPACGVPTRSPPLRRRKSGVLIPLSTIRDSNLAGDDDDMGSVDSPPSSADLHRRSFSGSAESQLRKSSSVGTSAQWLHREPPSSLLDFSLAVAHDRELLYKAFQVRPSCVCVSVCVCMCVYCNAHVR